MRCLERGPDGEQFADIKMKWRYSKEAWTHKEERYEYKVHQLLVALLIQFQGCLVECWFHRVCDAPDIGDHSPSNESGEQKRSINEGGNRNEGY